MKEKPRYFSEVSSFVEFGNDNSVTVRLTGVFLMQHIGKYGTDSSVHKPTLHGHEVEITFAKSEYVVSLLYKISRDVSLEDMKRLSRELRKDFQCVVQEFRIEDNRRELIKDALTTYLKFD